MSLLKPTATIGFYTMLSRVLGFIRDMTIAASLGASWLSDAFFVAFKIPNFFRRLFAEGAFNAAFVPLYAGARAAEGKEEAMAMAEEAYAFLVAVLLVVSAAFIFFMPWLMMVLAPGFVDQPEKFDLTVLLTRITFPYIIFISVVSLLGGILNSVHRFAAVAATPVLMNLCLIFIPPMIAAWTPTEAHGLAIAVFIAGVVQMVWLQFWAWREGVRPRLKWPRMTKRVKKLLLLIAPAAAGAGVAQINLFIDLIIATSIDSGVSYLYYADRINELPLAVIGIAIGTVLLPTLSRHVREGNHAAAHATQNRGIELALLLSLPAAAALMVIAAPIIQVLYQRGAFTAADAAETVPALVAFAAGLPAFVLIKVLGPAFYAHQDTKTPLKIALICIGVNLALNLALILPLKHVGMAIATTTAGWLNVWLMVANLRKRKLFKWDAALLKRLPRIFAAALIMAAALGVAHAYLTEYFARTLWWQVGALTTLIATGLLIYALATLMLRAFEISQLKRYITRSK